MRVAVVSDVHGNLPALEAVLAEVEREGVGLDEVTQHFEAPARGA